MQQVQYKLPSESKDGHPHIQRHTLAGAQLVSENVRCAGHCAEDRREVAKLVTELAQPQLGRPQESGAKRRIVGALCAMGQQPLLCFHPNKFRPLHPQSLREGKAQH